jgi:hypothetical protein
VLFRQQFRRDLHAGRFNMEFAQSAAAALQATPMRQGCRLSSSSPTSTCQG